MELELIREAMGRIINHPKFITKTTGDSTTKAVHSYSDPLIRHIAAQYNKDTWRNASIKINIALVPIDVLKEFRDKVFIKKEGEDKSISNIRYILGEWLKIIEHPDKYKFQNPKGFGTAVEATMSKTPNRLIFRRDIDNNLVPYLFNKTTYTKAHREDNVRIKASCTLHFKYYDIDNQNVLEHEITYYSDKVKNSSVKQLLATKGYYVEDKELYAEYEAIIKKFNNCLDSIGKQFIGEGHYKKVDKKNESYYWYRSYGEWYKLMTDGTPPNLIMDDATAERETPVYVQNSWFSYFDDEEDDGDDSDDGEEDDAIDEEDGDEAPRKKKVTKIDTTKKKKFSFLIPYHPYVVCFNLNTDMHVKVHVNNLKEYKYDAKLMDRLILPEDDVELLDLLCHSSVAMEEDIISGKTGGIMVLGTGIAGTGKTLTAEVFSEYMGRPLYKIQSSQLGIQIGELDVKLRNILKRAMRWNAILLVDEADVYIRSRGTDIEQNAVVGVFLRVLEYFSGIIFFLSNLDDIDDAIESRATAHIKYDYPTPTNLRKIWEIQKNQYKLNISDDVIDKFCTSVEDKMVGRDVKNMCKLAKIYSNKSKDTVTIETLKKISKFKDINSKPKDKK